MKIDAQSFMKNKLVYTLFALIFLSVSYKGQRHEVGLQIGMSSMVGDIGRTNYLQKPILSNITDYGVPIHIGALYRMNFNPYQTVRLNISYSNVQFVDAFAKEKYRRDRKLWGTNSIIEGDVLFEYNFFPVNDEQKSMASPYIFAGLGALYGSSTKVTIANDFRRDANGVAQSPTNNQDFTTTPTYVAGKQLSMAIPFGIGLKYKFNYNWAFFGELMFRPTFSDSIDYSQIDEKNVKQSYNKDIPGSGNVQSLLQESPYLEVAEARAAEFITSRQIGNINSKDWVNSVSVGLTYSFGRPPCYCEQ